MSYDPQNMDQTYKIENGYVYRHGPNNELLGWMPINYFRVKSELLWTLQSHTEKTREIYLIARDELIDRGLLPNAKD